MYGTLIRSRTHIHQLIAQIVTSAYSFWIYILRMERYNFCKIPVFHQHFIKSMRSLQIKRKELPINQTYHMIFLVGSYKFSTPSIPKDSESVLNYPKFDQENNDNIYNIKETSLHSL
jgi:hypothetical protein